MQLLHHLFRISLRIFQPDVKLVILELINALDFDNFYYDKNMGVGAVNGLLITMLTLSNNPYYLFIGSLIGMLVL